MSDPRHRSSELDPPDLHDEDHRDELRDRFEMLLQELRVVLPGVQILLAFLLIAPFSERFGELDALGRGLYGVALGASAASTVVLLAPTILHRLGDRRARSNRLIWSVRLFVTGIALLSLGLTAAIFCVARFVYGAAAQWAIVASVLAALAATWTVLPLMLRRRR